LLPINSTAYIHTVFVKAVVKLPVIASMAFTVNIVVARSAVPLSIASGQRVVVNTTKPLVLWGYNREHTPSTFVAFNSTQPSSRLRVGLEVSDDLVGKTLKLVGFLYEEPAVMSSVQIDTNQVVAKELYLMNQSKYPMAYWGDFEWKLVDDEWNTMAMCDTLTYLEMYAPLVPTANLWPSFGISASLLRQYIAVRTKTRLNWWLPDFYRDLTHNILAAQFQYDNVFGAPEYAGSEGGVSFALDRYFADLDTGLQMRVNCYDMAGIVQIILSLYSNYDQFKWNYMEPYDPTV
jgi:hypothetical protein